MRRELKRQGFHLVFGLTLALLYWVLPYTAFLVTCALVILLLAVVFGSRNPIRAWAYTHFERAKDKRRFPGRGAVYFLLGALLTALIFPAYALPAILVVAIADSASTVFGKWLGRRKTPWSDNKSWAGITAFFVGAVLALLPFTSAWLVGALVATLVEAGDYREIIFLDDNLLIPLAVGAFLTLVSLV